jgi:hypothetical protein
MTSKAGEFDSLEQLVRRSVRSLEPYTNGVLPVV